MKNCIIRDAVHSDLEAIRAMYNHAIVNTTAVYEYDTFGEPYMEEWWKSKQSGRWPVVVFEMDGIAVAFGTYGTFRARAAYVSCVEHSLYVHPDYQGRGLGKEMLRVLIQRAQNDGRHTMVAGVDANNAVSIRLHLEQGFREVGRLSEVAYKFDRWLDLVFLQLTL
jgi:L-amino acid N-acyltransferase YncA